VYWAECKNLFPCVELALKAPFNAIAKKGDQTEWLPVVDYFRTIVPEILMLESILDIVSNTLN
jgi:hypothetical protein